MPDAKVQSPTEHSGDGHVRILIGLAAGVLAGLIANVAQQPDLGGGVIQYNFGDVISFIEKHAFGSDATDRAEFVAWLVSVAGPIGKLFLRLMQMMVLPLVVSALFLAVVDVGDLRKLGRIGLTTLFYTAILSISAVLIGITLVNVVQPGRTISPEVRDSLRTKYAANAEEGVKKADAAKPLGQTLVDLLPENPVQEMVGAVDGSSKGNGMLAVMFFALLCGIAATSCLEDTAVLVGTLRGVYQISMTVIGWALKLAPLGAGCLVFVVTTQMGPDILKALAAFVGVVLGGLAIHLLIVYSAVLWIFGKRSPLAFFRSISDAMFVAFSTSSSSATLSTSLKVAQEELKLRPETSNFVLTVGATGNQNGTALFEGVVVLFLAQVFGVELNFGQQITVVLMSVLAGVGTAGVPGGSIPLIIVVLKSVGVPADGIAIILGVDRLLDMSRTLVNVVGDLVVATCVDASATRALKSVGGSHSS
jgi:DAACS family dicarboxylate/amino acid:cation (Na+ or H+) symporter